jgi:uncharacterized membrane protein YgdD (TMEM256/DUF423 family)
MSWTAAGAILLALAVILGAFGAHALRPHLDPYLMSVYERAAFYHFIHALGLLIVSVLPRVGVLTANAGARVCALLFAGVILFSGSLYLLALTGARTFGAVTPIGGLSFIAAWLLLAVALIRGASDRS